MRLRIDTAVLDDVQYISHRAILATIYERRGPAFCLVRKALSECSRGVPTVTFLEWLPGGSGAFLAEDSEQQLWAVKQFYNKQGLRLLANEFVGALLLRAVGLHCPPWRSVRLRSRDVNGRLLCERVGFNEENLGLSHFASRYLAEPEFVTVPLGLCPENEPLIEDILGVYVFDLWAAQTDIRELVLAYDRHSDETRLVAIDNGHLFYGPSERCSSKERNGTLLTTTMEAVVTQTESLIPSLRWVERLQSILPVAIESAIRASCPWRTNEIIANPKHFLDRLTGLQSLVFDDWNSKRSACPSQVAQGLTASQRFVDPGIALSKKYGSGALNRGDAALIRTTGRQLSTITVDGKPKQHSHVYLRPSAQICEEALVPSVSRRDDFDE